ncbi:hypothetical protein HMPREF7215_2096 [Pyramidobacter piscolens W5455]|uniref:Uncharacterized protein n=1 Tax=Pyramidobacter piscolens W5455 TaxID=352165 RepID=A0ABP2HVH5_9BACT|nr:hypothetical protein HMPREF7215_2096 [Pyramidobacter piscolens W5455]
MPADSPPQRGESALSYRNRRFAAISGTDFYFSFKEESL